MPTQTGIVASFLILDMTIFTFLSFAVALGMGQAHIEVDGRDRTKGVLVALCCYAAAHVLPVLLVVTATR